MRHAAARRGTTRHGAIRRDTTRHDATRRDTTRYDAIVAAIRQSACVFGQVSEGSFLKDPQAFCEEPEDTGFGNLLDFEDRRNHRC
jgi:hypothetical protein